MATASYQQNLLKLFNGELVRGEGGDLIDEIGGIVTDCEIGGGSGEELMGEEEGEDIVGQEDRNRVHRSTATPSATVTSGVSAKRI